MQSLHLVKRNNTAALDDSSVVLSGSKVLKIAFAVVVCGFPLVLQYLFCILNPLLPSSLLIFSFLPSSIDYSTITSEE